MRDKTFTTLTRAEMQLMNILWTLPDGGSVYDLLERYPEPVPAYTTVSTFLSILDKKGFVTHRKAAVGKTYIYVPCVSREEYTRQAMREMKDNFFGGSLSSLLHFFAQEEKLTPAEVAELIEMAGK